MSQMTSVKEHASEYARLYRIAGAAALIAACLTVLEVIAFSFLPQPSTVRGWFILFQAKPFAGLVDFWGLEVPMYVMFALMFLALYFVLRKVNESGMAIALTLALLGIAIFFATNNPFSMLSLSNKFAAATTDAQKSALLAAGEAILAQTNQRAIGGFNLGLFLVSTAGLVVSSVMLSAGAFRGLTARVGILAFGLSLADYLRQVFTSSELIALIVILPAAILLVIWLMMVGRRLLQLSRPEA